MAHLGKLRFVRGLRAAISLQKKPLRSPLSIGLLDGPQFEPRAGAGRDSFRDNLGDSRVPATRRRRFAKLRSPFRPSSFFLANHHVPITSSIERVGCCWLREPGFGSWQGQFQGQPLRPAVPNVDLELVAQVRSRTPQRDLNIRGRVNSSDCRAANSSAFTPSSLSNFSQRETATTPRRWHSRTRFCGIAANTCSFGGADGAGAPGLHLGLHKHVQLVGNRRRVVSE